jgi:hypothetical protein
VSENKLIELLLSLVEKVLLQVPIKFSSAFLPIKLSDDFSQEDTTVKRTKKEISLKYFISVVLKTDAQYLFWLRGEELKKNTISH